MHTKRKMNRILSLLLSIAMLGTVLPMTVFAEETESGTETAVADEAPAEEPAAEEAAPAAESSAEPTEEAPVEESAAEEAAPAEEPSTELTEKVLTASLEETPSLSAEVSADDTSASSSFTATAPADPDFYSIVFLDCGRKYFSVSSIEALIDNAASAGMNTVELAIGNDGLRFLLDDMSLTVNGTTYTSAAVSAGIHSGNEAYSDFTVDELTQAEMDEIIAYAYSKGISIIPCLNSPGHMDAIIDCMESCGNLGTVAYNYSARTVDVTNSKAVAFTQALIAKYAAYFASRGCRLFNMGADEYANDVYTTGSMGFGNLISSNKYSYYVSYVNGVASIIENAGMTPMAFNDGIYFNDNTSGGTFDTNIIVCYWSNGWSGYTPMSAADLQSKGFRLINAHGDYYWVLGKSSWQCTAEKASGFDVNTFQGGTISNPVGAQFSIWCDYPQAGTESSVISTTQSVITAFGAQMPSASGGGTDDAGSSIGTVIGTTSDQPFDSGTGGSTNFRIPAIASTSGGELIAATDARYITTADGYGLDTMVSYSTDNGSTWKYAYVNYNDDSAGYNTGASAFIDPALAVSGDTVSLFAGLYPAGGVYIGNCKSGTGYTTVNGESVLALYTSTSASASSTPSYYVSNTKNSDGYYPIYTYRTSAATSYYVDAEYDIYTKSGSTYTAVTGTQIDNSGKTIQANLFYTGTANPTGMYVLGTYYLTMRQGSIQADGSIVWGGLTILNPQVKNSSESFYGISPGGAMVASTGRIIVPMYTYANSADGNTSVIYSDDGGETWTRGASVSDQTSEGSVSEVDVNGTATLYMFTRHGGYYTSTDMGATWSSKKTVSDISYNTSCEVSTLTCAEKIDGCSAILLSAPSSTSSRSSGKIYVGLVQADGSLAWKYSYQVNSDTYQYSDMAELTDGSIALLYENGSASEYYTVLPISTIAAGAQIGSQLIERTEMDFDAGWKFCLGDVSASSTSYNDSGWTEVTLPHDFSISQSFTTSGEAESGFLPGGTGWYRKTFTLDKSYSGKDVLLSFDGVYSDAYVYVNGTYVGENHYGYNCFAFDISDYVTCDGTTQNVVAVKAVNNIPSSRWYSGSGIYRDVTLIVTNEVHVDLNGVSVTTPNISSGDGTAQTAVEIVNSGSEAETVKVKTEIFAYGGSEVKASDEAEISVPAGGSAAASCAPMVSSPALWSTTSPNLYTAKVTLTVNDETVDTTSVNFGYRWYEFTSTGFYLNGSALKLNGVCLHHDQGGLGSAAYSEAIYRQLRTMMDMGVNAIRCTHNPADRSLIEYCDQLGILVIEELFDGWSAAKNGNTNDFSQYFNTAISSSNKIYGAQENETWAQYAAQSVIRRDRNSASVILWSLGNEITEGTTSGTSDYATTAQNLITWVKAEDTSRPTTLGDNQKGSSTLLTSVLKVIVDNGGVVGFNYASSSQLSSLHLTYSALFSSETSSATNSRGIYSSQNNNTAADSSYHLTSYDTSAVGWGMTAHDSLWNTYTADYIAGEFVWTGFDYIGEPTPYNGTGTGSVTGSGAVPNSSYFGIVDTCGFEKDTYYFYRSQWNKNANTLHLVTAWDSSNMMTTSGKTPVVIYSNAPVVKLYRDGTLIGTATRSDHTVGAGTYYTYSATSNDSSVCTAVSGSGSTSLYAAFNVVYTAGTLSAKAFDESGNDITASCAGQTSVTTPGSAAKVTVSLDNAEYYAGDLAYIAFDVVDANGNPVTTADNTLNITVSGGTILAVDNGNQATTAKYQQSSVLLSGQSAQIAAYAGKALAIVRGGAGTQITVSSSGLAGATYTIGSGSSEPDPTETDEFMKMVLIDCGRGYYTVEQIETLLDKMAECGYDSLVLGFGNDGLRFVLDDMSVTANGTTYDSDTVKNAVIAANDSLAPNAKGQFTETDMENILAYAKSRDISIIPFLNSPGHDWTICKTMTACGISDASYSSSGSDSYNVSVNLDNDTAVAFLEALVAKYIDYFAANGCTMFNLGCDEIGGNSGGQSSSVYAKAVSYINAVCAKMPSTMTPLAFTDILGSTSGYPDNLIGINWAGTSLSGHKNLNANDNWYYVLGYTGTGWSGYDGALAKTKSIPVTTMINDSSMPVGSVLAIWNDQYVAAGSYIDNIKTLMESQSGANPTYFTPASAHNYEVVESETVDATCTESGSVTYKCSDCGRTYSETVAPLGHSYNAENDSGDTVYTCVRCGSGYTMKLDRKYVKVAEGETSSVYTISGEQSIRYSGNTEYASANLSVEPGTSASTSYSASASVSSTAYSTYAASNLIDGDSSTFYWSSSAQNSGMYARVDLGAEVRFDAIQVTSTSHASDYCTNANVQVSSDGSTWTTIGTFTGKANSAVSTTYEVPSSVTSFRYIQVVLTSTSNYWWQLAEIAWGSYTNGTFTRAAASGTVVTGSPSTTSVSFTGLQPTETNQEAYYVIDDTRYVVTVTAASVGLVDTDGSVADTVSRTMNMGTSETVKFSGKTSGSTIMVSSSNKTVADASVSGNIITIKSLLDGTADITVTETKSDGTSASYTIQVTVSKNYTSVQEISLGEGESTTWTDTTGDYSSTVNSDMLNSAIADIKVTGVTQPATPATDASTAKLSSFVAGNVVIGYESGSTNVYLVLNGTSFTTTTNPETATVWTLSGSSTAATLKSGSYYLCHSTSAISASTSATNASWKFSAGSLYYTSTSSRSRSRTYYLRYSSGFRVSTSTSSKAAVYTVTPGTDEIAGEASTTVTVNALTGGTTGFVMNDTLYRIIVKAAHEHEYTSKVTKEPTCTAAGVRTYTCTVCGATSEETIAQLAHDYKTTTTAATCTEAGSTVTKCSMCGDVSSTTIPALGHDYQVTSTTPATCAAEGEKIYTCSRCGDSYSETIAKTTNHTYNSGEVTTEPTCTAAGVKTYTCTVCKASYTEAIPATGHSYTTKTTAATCTKAGSTVKTCSKCNDTSSTTIPALGHDYQLSSTTPATCAAEGENTYTCSRCGDSYSETIAKTTNHTYNSGEVTTEPTCTAAGVKTYTCTVCGATSEETIAQLAHDYKTTTTAATCTEAGSTVTKCSMCGDVSSSTTLPALGHNYTASVGDTVITYTCSNCGDTYTEAIPSTTYDQVSTISSGNQYLITVVYGSTTYALTHNGTTLGVAAVTVTDGQVTSEVTDSMIWNYRGTFSYTNGSTTYYLYKSSSSFGRFFSRTYTLKLSTSGTSATYSNSKHRLSFSNYYLYYSGSSFSLSRSSYSTCYMYQVNG